MTYAEALAICQATWGARPPLDPDNIIDRARARSRIFTDEERALVWCPEPPRESTGGSDCRAGGACGLDASAAYETLHGRWVRARLHLWKERKRAEQEQEQEHESAREAGARQRGGQ